MPNHHRGWRWCPPTCYFTGGRYASDWCYKTFQSPVNMARGATMPCIIQARAYLQLLCRDPFPPLDLVFRFQRRKLGGEGRGGSHPLEQAQAALQSAAKLANLLIKSQKSYTNYVRSRRYLRSGRGWRGPGGRPVRAGAMPREIITLQVGQCGNQVREGESLAFGACPASALPGIGRYAGRSWDTCGSADRDGVLAQALSGAWHQQRRHSSGVCAVGGCWRSQGRVFLPGGR